MGENSSSYVGNKDTNWCSDVRLIDHSSPSSTRLFRLIPEKTAENFQKSGAYIPGVRPGKGTEEFMSRLLRRLASVGSVFGFITIIPILARDLFGLTDAVALGGTSLLIIISTGIEGMKQLEGYLLKT